MCVCMYANVDYFVVITGVRLVCIMHAGKHTCNNIRAQTRRPNVAMDQNIVDIVQRLKHCRADGKFTPEGNRYLLVLNYLLPDLFVTALDLIESKSCHAYTHGPTAVRVIKGYLVNTKLWGCTCKAFTMAMVTRHGPICEHLIGGYLMDELGWWEEQARELDQDDFASI